jgi:hypothetical protein
MRARRPTSFPNEDMLQRYLFREASAAEDKPYSWARREMPIGGRIPDVVIVSFEKAPPAKLWPRRFSFRHAAIMAVLRQRPNVSIETVARRCYEREECISSAVADLLRAGAVEEYRPGIHRLSPAVSGLQVQVTAIEAKLTRWSEALAQAQTYTQFADHVFVALDASCSISTKVRTAFRLAGIGLWSSSESSLQSVVSPRAQRTWTAEREYVIASVVAPRSSSLWQRRGAPWSPSHLVCGAVGL